MVCANARQCGSVFAACVSNSDTSSAAIKYATATCHLFNCKLAIDIKYIRIYAMVTFMKHGILPPAERDVLACLHRLGHATAREIREGLAPYRPMTHGALTTLLKRLEAKKLVCHEKGSFGKAFVFQPVQAAKETFAGLVGQMVHRVFNGNGVTMMASLFETHPPTPQEVEELQRMLDKLKKGRRK